MFISVFLYSTHIFKSLFISFSFGCILLVFSGLFSFLCLLIVKNATVTLSMVSSFHLLFLVFSCFLVFYSIPYFYTDIPDFYTEFPYYYFSIFLPRTRCANWGHIFKSLFISFSFGCILLVFSGLFSFLCLLIVKNATVTLSMVSSFHLLFLVFSCFLVFYSIPYFYTDIPDFYTEFPYYSFSIFLPRARCANWGGGGWDFWVACRCSWPRTRFTWAWNLTRQPDSRFRIPVRIPLP